MPNYTTNLNLVKPLVTEQYDIAKVTNDNADILDSEIKAVKDDVLDKQDTLVSGTNIKTINGNSVLGGGDVELLPKNNPTATGTQTFPSIVTNGIKFPATQVASADPNTLDDYEEGTFSPTLIGLTTPGTGNVYALQSAVYTKVGNLVTVFGRVSLSTKGNATGLALISGLPFPIKAITARVKGHIPQVVNVTGITIDNLHGTYLFNQGGVGSFVLANSAGTGLDFNAITNSTILDFLATYTTD